MRSSSPSCPAELMRAERTASSIRVQEADTDQDRGKGAQGEQVLLL